MVCSAQQLPIRQETTGCDKQLLQVGRLDLRGLARFGQHVSSAVNEKTASQEFAFQSESYENAHIA